MKFVSIDVETANANMSSICQIGIATYENGALAEAWKSLVNPDDYFDALNVSIHGIDEQAVERAPTLQDIAQLVSDRMEGQVVVSHTHFDRVAIRQAFVRHGLQAPACTWLDSARMVRRAWGEFGKSGYGLKNVCDSLGISFDHHDALEDAKAAGHVVIAAINKTGIDLEGWLQRFASAVPDHKDIAREGNSEGQLFGEVLVFTGALAIPRREAADIAAKMGCTVAKDVTKKTTILVVGDQDISRLAGKDKSERHLKAEGLIVKGQMIRILGESDFRYLATLED